MKKTLLRRSVLVPPCCQHSLLPVRNLELLDPDVSNRRGIRRPQPLTLIKERNGGWVGKTPLESRESFVFLATLLCPRLSRGRRFAKFSTKKSPRTTNEYSSQM